MKRFSPFFTSFAGSSLVLIVLSLVNRGIGFFREVVYASQFGVSEEFDIFLVVSIVPITINTIVYYIAQNYIIPNYIDYFDDDLKAEEFLINNYTGFGLMGLMIAIFLFLFDKVILSFWIGKQDLNNTYILTFDLFILTIPISSVYAVVAAHLNSKKKFSIPALTAIIQNIAVVVLVLLANNIWGIISIAIGYLIGTVIQLIYAQYKSKIGFTINLLKRITLRSWLQTSSQSLILIIIIEFVSQLYTISDRLFFPYIDVGSLSALNYAQNIALLPITIISLSINTVLFPRFSENINTLLTENDSLFMKSIQLTLLIFIPVFIVFTFWSNEVVSIVYERGKFIPSDSLKSSELLTYLGYGILFYSLYAVLNKIIYSQKLYKSLLLITVVSIGIKFLLNYLLVIPLNFYGLAISTSITYTIFFCMSVFLLKSVIGLKWLLSLAKEFIQLLFNAIISYVVIEEIIPESVFAESKIFYALKILLFLCLFFINYILVNPEIISTIFTYSVNINKNKYSSNDIKTNN